MGWEGVDQFRFRKARYMYMAIGAVTHLPLLLYMHVYVNNFYVLRGREGGVGSKLK